MGTLARLLYGAHFTADQVTLQVETREQVPSAVSVSLEQVACWGVRVDGMQTAVSAQQQPPRYSLAIADGGFHCSIGRVDVNRGPAADGALRVRLSDKAVGALGQLAALTPLSGMRVAAEKLTADFVLALSPRGSSGLPAGIKLERSEVGAALTVNIASLGPLSGVAGLATQLLSQTLSSLIKDELALIITLDLGPALARFEESQVAALAARPLARAEPPGGFIWTELGRDSVGGDNAAAATLSWLNSTLSNASLGAEAASRVARVSRFRDSSERHSAAWLPFPVRLRLPRRHPLPLRPSSARALLLPTSRRLSPCSRCSRRPPSTPPSHQTSCLCRLRSCRRSRPSSSAGWGWPTSS